jgi:hypothetical protein
MIGMNSYLNAYVDRRMKNIVVEWDLSTRADLDDVARRIEVLELEIPRLTAFEHAAADKLTELEGRASRLKGRL